MSRSRTTFESRVEDETIRLGDALARITQPGDLILLYGDLGMGKSVLARAMVRTWCDNQRLDVPSPTFTLMQTYQNPEGVDLAHLDLYRLESPDELIELGLDEGLEKGAAIVEWPNKGELDSAKASLAFTFQEMGEDGRLIHIEGEATRLEALQREVAIQAFLERSGYGDCRQHFMFGDASTRSYVRLERDGQAKQFLLMNAPPQPDGPPIRDGRSYSDIANLAEDMRAFEGIGKRLEIAGCTVPRVHAADHNAGLLIIDHIGEEGVLNGLRQPIEERYLASVELLAEMHGRDWSASIEVSDGVLHEMNFYDQSAMAIEVDLLPQWYAAYRLGRDLTGEEYQSYTAIWAGLIDALDTSPRTLVLRDFHSPNILWQSDKTGIRRVGLIDYQDGLMGPSAYDVASLAQDARVDIPSQLEQQLVEHYCFLRSSSEGFDEKSFCQDYAIMAAQRASKILGIFVRLSKRDGKDGYLANLPRMEDYLHRSLKHPALAPLKDWVENVIS